MWHFPPGTPPTRRVATVSQPDPPVDLIMQWVQRPAIITEIPGFSPSPGVTLSTFIHLITLLNNLLTSAKTLDYAPHRKWILLLHLLLKKSWWICKGLCVERRSLLENNGPTGEIALLREVFKFAHVSTSASLIVDIDQMYFSFHFLAWMISWYQSSNNRKALILEKFKWQHSWGISGPWRAWWDPSH